MRKNWPIPESDSGAFAWESIGFCLTWNTTTSSYWPSATEKRFISEGRFCFLWVAFENMMICL